MSTLLASDVEVKVGPQLRRVMLALNYPPVNIAAAQSWVEHRGTVGGCPVVDLADVAVIDLASEVDRRIQLASASEWPAWVDGFVWEPTEPEADGPPARVTSFGPTLDDELYWSLNSPSNRDGYTVVSRPHTPRPIRRPANDWSDADQLLHHGCV